MISIIIPLYNEENNIEALWASLLRLEPCEIIFVDGGSRDRTIEYLENRIARTMGEHAKASSGDTENTDNGVHAETTGQRRIFSAENMNTTELDTPLIGATKGTPMRASWHSLYTGHRVIYFQSPECGRAVQMNYGAGFASGDLLFLHADTKVPKTAIADIESVLERYEAGCFRLRFAPETFLLFFCGRLSGFRVMSRRVMFGDQGIFVRRELFERLGGFAEIPLMEDYDFSIRLKQKGIAIGMTKSKLITSGRRFLEKGTIRTMVRMQRLQYRFRHGADPGELAKRY